MNNLKLGQGHDIRYRDKRVAKKIVQTWYMRDLKGT